MVRKTRRGGARRGGRRLDDEEIKAISAQSVKTQYNTEPVVNIGEKEKKKRQEELNKIMRTRRSLGQRPTMPPPPPRPGKQTPAKRPRLCNSPVWAKDHPKKCNSPSQPATKAPVKKRSMLC